MTHLVSTLDHFELLESLMTCSAKLIQLTDPSPFPAGALETRLQGQLRRKITLRSWIRQCFKCFGFYKVCRIHDSILKLAV